MHSKWSEYICNSSRKGGITSSIPEARDPKMLGFIMNENYYNPDLTHISLACRLHVITYPIEL